MAGACLIAYMSSVTAEGFTAAFFIYSCVTGVFAVGLTLMVMRRTGSAATDPT